jgi:hypothetical protein
LAQSGGGLIRSLLASIAECEMSFSSKVVNSCEALLLSAMAGCQLGLLFVAFDVVTEQRGTGNPAVQEARVEKQVIETVVVRG